MDLKHIQALKCLICGKTYSPDDVAYVCPDHGTEGILDVVYDYEHINDRFSKADLDPSTDFSVWRYKPLLPVDQDCIVPPLPVGWTPLIELTQMAADFQVGRFYLKDDGRQPTASLKDRASILAVVKAAEKNAEVITTASTGNAAAALSGLCASVQQANVIFVPASAPQAKITQLLVFGSTVILVKGTYDQAFDLCLEAAENFGWYNRNTGFNPYMTEGKKTVAYEICEQLNWKAPDKIFVSVGDGCIIGGIHKGLKDLLALGWIDKMPQLIGVQAEGSSYLAQAWQDNEDVLTKPACSAETIADSISAGLPRDRLKAMAAVKETDGVFVTVSDTEILQAVTGLARKSGVFAEPAGAAAFAGFQKLAGRKELTPDESVVVVNTGNGLKDINSAMKAVDLTRTRVFQVNPSFQEIRQLIDSNRFES